MFTEFFYTLRKRKLPVSVTEWMTLMEALSRGYVTNLDEFYFLARAILVKNEAYFDQYDVAFQEYFSGIEAPAEITEQIKRWLEDPLEQMLIDRGEHAGVSNLEFDELMKQLEERLKAQTRQHDGGGYWLGRYGDSSFGHSGSNQGGVRVGGTSGGRHAMQIAQRRLFQNYRNDLTLDVRQVKIALKKLRRLTRIGLEEELDLDKTIDETCKNAGEIELVWRPSRKNAVKVLLLMDVGGSMEPFALLMSRLFSAAHSSSHFKDFKYYYFHNCVYDNVYRDIEREDALSTDDLLRTTETDYRLMLVGDARMAISELIYKSGAIDYYQRNEIPGLIWLKHVAEHFTHSVWLNPDPQRIWNHETVQLISKIFPMFSLTLDGLGEAVTRLVVRK